MARSSIWSVPDGGMDLWESPNAQRPPIARLTAGVELMIVQRSGDWALVEVGTGWRGWVDARRLMAVAHPNYTAARRARPRFLAITVVVLVVVLALGGLAAFWLVRNPTPGSTDSADHVGVAPPLEQVDSAWPSAPVTAGLSLSYPADWQVIQGADDAIVLLQPGSPHDRPVPNISFSFEPGVTVSRPALVDGMSAPVATTLAGLQGWEYRQTGLVVPAASTFIDLDYHGGRLQISATRGPAVNLVPQLEEILKTMKVAP